MLCVWGGVVECSNGFLNFKPHGGHSTLSQSTFLSFKSRYHYFSKPTSFNSTLLLNPCISSIKIRQTNSNFMLKKEKSTKLVNNDFENIEKMSKAWFCFVFSFQLRIQLFDCQFPLTSLSVVCSFKLHRTTRLVINTVSPHYSQFCNSRFLRFTSTLRRIYHPTCVVVLDLLFVVLFFIFVT